MKRLFMILILLTTMLGFVKEIRAQGEAALVYLLLAPDSRFAGMGESGTGLADNSSAIFWNPSGVAFQSGTEIGITHSNWLPQFGLDLSYDYVTFRTYIESIDGSFTSSLTYMNYGEFQHTSDKGPEVLGTFRSFDLALTLGYATKLGEDFGLGFNFRIIHSNLSTVQVGQEQGRGVATTVSADVGAMWRPKNILNGNFSLGANLSNMGPKISYIDQDQADPLPTNLRLGLAYRVFEDDFNSFTITADASKLLVSKRYNDEDTVVVHPSELRSIEYSAGAEYWYGQPEDFMFAVRGGYFYEDPEFGGRNFLTFGAGIRYDLYGFDFSYISTTGSEAENHPLDGTLRFSLLIEWGVAERTARGLPRGI